MERKVGKNRISKTRKIRGFTLVELIVVITVLATLATIGFLALSGYSQDAKDSAAKANVRSLQTAISSEAAITGNSPRHYMIHDADYALSGAFVHIDGAPVALTGWDVGQAPLDSNYTAGKPDFKKLRLNPEKFRISAYGLPDGTLGTLVRAAGFGTDSAEASYDAGSLMAAGADFSVTGANGKKRMVSYVQAWAVAPATKTVSVSGNFPTSGVPAGMASWLLRAEPGSATNLTGALMDGAAGITPVDNGQNPSTPQIGWDQYSTGVTALLHFDGRVDNGDAYRNEVSSNFRMEGVDGSANFVDDTGKAFTSNGTMKITTGTGKYGAGGYFNGASYLTANAYSSEFSITAGDFTVEAWVFNTQAWVRAYNTIAATQDWTFYITNGDVLKYVAQGVGAITGPTIPKNVWTHVAVVRSWTSTKIYVNGAESGSATINAKTPTATQFALGSDPAGLTSRQFQGYMDDFRITKGVARYSGTFTSEQIPPSSGPAAVDQKNADITPNGDAKISSVQSKFWGASSYFDGTGDYFSMPYVANSYDWWVNDYTLEMWIYPTNLASWGIINGGGEVSCAVGNANISDSGNHWSFWPISTWAVKLYYWNGGSVHVTSTEKVVANQWNHIAFTKTSAGIKIWVNGIWSSQTAISWTPISGSSLLAIGGLNTKYGQWHIDELRITKGVARYSSNFAIPASAYPNP